MGLGEEIADGPDEPGDGRSDSQRGPLDRSTDQRRQGADEERDNERDGSHTQQGDRQHGEPGPARSAVGSTLGLHLDVPLSDEGEHGDRAGEEDDEQDRG